jgi:hypothetical protein
LRAALRTKPDKSPPSLSPRTAAIAFKNVKHHWIGIARDDSVR